MWALFVITLLYEIDDAKVTRYGEYDSLWDCNNELNKIEKEGLGDYTMALCAQIGPVEPSPNVIY